MSQSSEYATTLIPSEFGDIDAESDDLGFLIDQDGAFIFLDPKAAHQLALWILKLQGISDICEICG